MLLVLLTAGSGPLSEDVRLAVELLCGRPRPVSADESDVAGLRSGTMPAGRQHGRRQHVNSMGVQGPLPSLSAGRPLHLPNGKLTGRRCPSTVGCLRTKALLRVGNIFCGLQLQHAVQAVEGTIGKAHPDVLPHRYTRASEDHSFIRVSEC